MDKLKSGCNLLSNIESMINPFELIDARLSTIESLLLDLKHLPKGNATEQPQAEQLLTIQQAASFLSLSVPTLYGYVSRMEIPVSKRGKRLYFSKQELVQWVQDGRKKTMAEIDAETNAFLSQKKGGNNV